jgi:FkbH-like protein
MEGIVLGPPSAPGSRFQELHHYLKALTRRGILLAVVSKNNPAEAENVFRSHQSCVLGMDDFVSFKANWEDKPSNIRNIAAELRLGIDSFVYLDDNPAERARVRRELSEIVVPEISGEPAESIAVLERGLYFQSNRLTEEDQNRHASYIALGLQSESRKSAGSVEDYLADLAMEIEYGPVDAESSVRVTQLVNKTNQFNLTTRRYSQEEIQHRTASPSHWMRWYRLRDRFADHGLIAVLFADSAGEEWKVDTWLMSCRVIGRGVEEFMLRDLAEAARTAGARRLRASYIPTAKNKLVEQLLPGMGFSPAQEPGDFTLDLRRLPVQECRFLKPCPRSLEIGA